ncbi:TetR/AcrR family transcriptional regulator [Polynucleobacter asymbioticus]|nr:TetR/AcrR family transcriptional regulator [Polynucleobacter asymbioticus]
MPNTSKTPKSKQVTPKQSRSLKAIDNILIAGKELIGSKKQTLNARALAEKSGYSIGNIYHHFEKIADVFVEIYLEKRVASQKKVAQLFIDHSPLSPITELAPRVTDQVISNHNEFDPKVLTFCLTALSKELNNPFEIDKSVEKLVAVFREVADKDQTNTFRKMTIPESELLAKTYVYALRQPYIDESELMGTEEHRQIMINMFYSLFGNGNHA